MDSLTLLGLAFGLAALFLLIGLQIAYVWFKIGDRIKNQQEMIRLLKKLNNE